VVSGRFAYNGVSCNSLRLGTAFKTQSASYLEEVVLNNRANQSLLVYLIPNIVASLVSGLALWIFYVLFNISVSPVLAFFAWLIGNLLFIAGRVFWFYRTPGE
jgi:hypothetical protein